MVELKPFVCYNITAKNPNEVWKTGDILGTELPVLAVQTCWTIFMTRLFSFILKPLHIPRLVAEVIAGFILSAQILGRVPTLYLVLYPIRGVLNVEVWCHLGAIYYAFLTGLEMNLDNVLRAQKKATSVAVAGVIIPMVMGVGLYGLHRTTYVLQPDEIIENNLFKAYLLWALALTVTGFPVLAQILASLKLLYTELGRSALNAAIISDAYSWLLFILVMPFNLNDGRGIYTVITTIIFITVCIYVVRPILTRIIDRKTDRQEWNDHRLLFVLMGTLLCAYITDILGSHSIVGAFVFGLILPHGRFTDVMMSAADDFASGVLAPLVFAGSGMRINLARAFTQSNWAFTALIMILLCIPKILSTLMATYIYGITVRHGLGLGLLMNTKGVMALIMLNIAWDRSILKVTSYSIITASVVTMTILSSIITNIVYNPRKRFKMNKLRTIQNSRVDVELRILACVHNTRHASSMVSILEGFNARRVSPLHVSALYLVELTGRGASVLLDHMRQPISQPGTHHLTQSQAELEGIAYTFEGLAEAYDAVRVETFNVVSSYATIHEDIFNSANEKRTSLILLPFHKQLNSEGSLEILNSAYKDINHNVMQESPCSVGIFVDRGIGSLSKTNYRILMLFVGGPDDREALAVAWRLAAHPGVQVSLVRMLLLDEAAEVDTSVDEEAQGILSAVFDSSKQKELDDDYVNSFRLKAMNNEDSITYSEREVHVGEDIPALLNDLDQNDYNLYIVGQGRGRNSVVFSRFLVWCDCPELGVIGDILASNNFGSRSSVLVVQQYGHGRMVSGNTFQQHPNNVDTKDDGFDTLINQV